METPNRLYISAGRIFTGAGCITGPGWVGLTGDRISAVGSGEPPARAAHRYPAGLLLPALVDLHAHPGRIESKFGVPPDEHFAHAGVTTVLAQGEAGADNLSAYLREVVQGARTRVLLALNLSRLGEDRPHGCFEAMEDADVDACVAGAQRGGKAVWGISANTSLPSCGRADPHEVLRRALVTAKATGLPLLVGTRRQPDVPLAQQLALLRAGDVVTYCFHPGPEGLLAGDRVRDCVWEARARGVRFDVGHGWASFAYAVAERCLAQGFAPDTISSDFYRRHVGLQPPHTLPCVAAKLVAAGLPAADALACVTHRPAEILGLQEECGALVAGAPADLTVLEDTPAQLADCVGQTRSAQAWRSVALFRGGRLET